MPHNQSSAALQERRVQANSNNQSPPLNTDSLPSFAQQQIITKGGQQLISPNDKSVFIDHNYSS
jgi:hypothetical protein